jgi:hypothetical protein
VVGEFAGERAVNQQRELAGSGGDGLGFADADRKSLKGICKYLKSLSSSDVLQLWRGWLVV